MRDESRPEKEAEEEHQEEVEMGRGDGEGGEFAGYNCWGNIVRAKRAHARFVLSVRDLIIRDITKEHDQLANNELVLARFRVITYARRGGMRSYLLACLLEVYWCLVICIARFRIPLK